MNSKQILPKEAKSIHFVVPNTIGMSNVNINEIVMKLPKPAVGKTARAIYFLKYLTDLNLFYVKHV